MNRPLASNPARVVVIGSGPVAIEVVRNLGLVDIPVAVHAPHEFWASLRLADLQDCYCAVAADADREASHRLNRLCQVAGVDFVSVVLGPDGIRVESFPFGSDPACACLECDATPCAGDGVPQAPDPIAASIAGALAAAAALNCSGHGAHRLSLQELNDASTSMPIRRRRDCAGCASPWRAPRVVRTRNRWATRDFLRGDATVLAAQSVQLSDAVVTACECTCCGPVAGLGSLLNRPVPPDATFPVACPSCGADTVRVELRDAFTLGELAERFGGGPVPVKFVLAEIGGTAVCFDLDAAAGEPGNPA